MKRTLLLAFSLAAAAASAQNLPLWWTGSTGSNDASDTTVATAIDATNSTYQLAKVTTSGNQDIRLTKFNSLGQAVWTRLYDFGTVDVANAMQLDADGDPVFVGSRFDAGTSTTQMLLAKADKTTGDLLWNRSYAPQAGGTSRIAFDFKILPDGTIIVAGTNNDAGGEHPSVVKFNESAAFALFTKSYSFIGRSTHIDYSGTHLFVGTELITPAHYLAVIRMPIADGVGDIIRPASNGGANYYQFSDIVALNDSSCALAGYLSSDVAGEQPISSLYGALNVVTAAHTLRTNPAETFFLSRDVEYDAAAGTVAYQAYLTAGQTYLLMGAYNPVTGLSDVTTVYGVVGAAVGLQSLGNNRFAAVTNNGANLAVNLVDFTLGWQSSTAVGPATVAVNPSGVPLAVHSNLSAAGRALAVGGSSAEGAKVFAHSFADGPNDDKRTKEDTSLAFNALLNDGSAGVVRSAFVNAQPTNGSVTVAENGDVVYTPNPNFAGTDSFSYFFIADGTLVATPTVTVTVLPVNDAPVATADNIGNIVYSGFTTVAPLGNDTDVESPAADLKVASVSGAVNCEVKIAADRKRVYVKPLAAGPFSFEYAAADPSGAKSAPVTVSGTYVQ